MHINGYPVAYGVIMFTVGLVARTRFKGHWAHRAGMILFGTAAFLLTLGVIPWQQALATLTDSGAGLVGLLIVALFAAGGVWWESAHQHRERRLRAHVYAVAAGISVLVLIGNSARLLSEA